MTKKENRIFGKTLKEILFEKINGEVYPRIFGDFLKLSEEEKKKLRNLPHLYKEGYRGSIIQEVLRADIDEETLKVWREHGFRPIEKFRAIFEYYEPLVKINLIFNIPVVEEEEIPEEIEDYENEEYIQQVDFSDTDYFEDTTDWENDDF